MKKFKRNSVSDVHSGRSTNDSRNEETAHPDNAQQDERDFAGGEEESNENCDVGESEQRPQRFMTSTGNPGDADKFIERARTHFAQEIDFAGARNQVPKNVVSQNTTLKCKNLQELFNGTEWQVLYRVTQLIHQHTDLNGIVSKETGDGVLHMAVKNKYVKVAERLLDNGALLESRNNNKLTPLHLALGQEDDKVYKTQRNPNKAEKCDEMAALIISKLKPYYVRYLFGDDTYFKERLILEEGGRNEPANTRFGHKALSGRDSNALSGRDSNALSGRDSNLRRQYKSFNFLKVVEDTDLQTTAATILNKLVDKHIDEDIQKPVVYYKLLTKDKTIESQTDGKGGKEEEVFQCIARRQQDLIKHPVVRAVILWKWTRKFHRRYLFDFIKFFVSFVAITICTVVGAQSDHIQLYNSPWQYVRAALEILTCIFIFESLWSELLQCYIDPKGYVRSILNWIEVGSSVCLIISIGLRYRDVNAHWYLFAVGYVLWTVKGLKYCAIYRHADAYKETLRALIKRDLFLFTVFFVALEMLFGGTLLLVLRGTNALNVEPDTESILSIYYIGLRTMIDGQTPGSLNVDNLPRVGEFVIIVFNSLTIVIMLNILIAQLSNTYNEAYKDGQIQSWVNRAEAIVNYEKEDGCKPFGKIRLFCWDCKRSPETDGTLQLDKEKLLEEKEKEDEMRAIMKQVDKTLLHTDLSVQTIKSKQTALLEDKKETPANTTNINQGQSGGTRDADKLEKQLNELKPRQEDMKAVKLQQDEMKKQQEAMKLQQDEMKKQQEAMKLQQDDIKKQQEAMKLQQDAILEAVGDIRNLLQKQE